MISALLFAAAGNFVPPSFTVEEVRQVQESYPNASQTASAVIDAQVDPKGRLSNCKADSTSGDAQLAQSICDHLKAIPIEPASVSGAASYGVIHHVVSLSAGASALSEPADIELQVNKLPNGSPLRVVANVLVDPAGKPQACYAANDAPAAYADVACTDVSGMTFGPINDENGKPVRYVRTVIIDFQLSSAQPAGG